MKRVGAVELSGTGGTGQVLRPRPGTPARLVRGPAGLLDAANFSQSLLFTVNRRWFGMRGSFPTSRRALHRRWQSSDPSCISWLGIHLMPPAPGKETKKGAGRLARG